MQVGGAGVNCSVESSEDYGQIVRALLEEALLREEKELKNLRKKARHVSLLSVCEYAESWIVLLLAKQQARSRINHGILVEKSKIDITLTKLPYQAEDEPLAYFELKGIFSASGLSGRADKCDKDIEALHSRKEGEGVERFFVLLLHAGSLDKARDAFRHLRSIKELAGNVQEVGRPTPMRLNPTSDNKSEDQLFVFMFRVQPRFVGAGTPNPN
jgi:hypothetical protein